MCLEWMSVCVSSNFFSNRCCFYSFCQILTKLGTHKRFMCVLQKKLKHIFKILILIFCKFCKILYKQRSYLGRQASLFLFFMYQSPSINKLQNDIILLIFKIWKFRNIRFVGNLIGDIGLYWNFYDDDVITVTSLVLRTQSLSAAFCPPIFFCNSQVLNSIVS